MNSYSLRDIVPDGWLGPSPRWVLHLVKLATHAGAAFAVVCLLAAFTNVPPFFLGGWIGGLMTYAGILIRKRWRYSPNNRPDWLFDASFPLAVTAGGLLADRDYFAGVLMLALAVSIYIAFRTRGVP